MSAIDLRVKFNEDGSGAVGFEFTGLSGEPVVPINFLWTLTDPNCAIINGREDVPEVPLETTWVFLQSADLADSVNSPVRFLTIKGTYNTILGGAIKNNVPYNEQYTFEINRFQCT